MLWLFATSMAAASKPLTCGECSVLQEAIQRSIVHNITDHEQKAIAGTSTTATIEIGQIIWHVCGSEAFKYPILEDRYHKACKKAVKKHVDMMTNYWKEKGNEEYKDPAIALRMKRAVCPSPDFNNACELTELPSDYAPLKADECSVCRALSSDLFGLVRLSRERPTSAGADSYFRLASLMGQACADMPMRHAMRDGERGKIIELCEDLWDEHESTLSRLALRRDENYAQNVCADELEVCEDATPLSELYAHDPSALGGGKEEL